MNGAWRKTLGEKEPSSERREETHFGVTLQRSTGFAIDIDDNTIRITRKVNSDIHLDLGHFLIDFRLQSRKLAISFR